MNSRPEGLRGVLAYVALGSNLGDRRALLRSAAAALDEARGVRVLRASRIWETAPVGPPQPDYLNAVLEVDVCLSPGAHLRLLHRIERGLGRERREGERWMARTIDLDLLWQGGLELRGPALELPHPRLQERSFVLVPLAELAPELVVRGHTVREWLEGRPAEERTALRPAGSLQLAGAGAAAPTR